METPTYRSKLEWMKTLRRADLSDAQFRVLVMVSTYAGKDGKGAHPGTQRLADDCGLSRRAVQNALRTLEATGWLVVEREGGNAVRKGFATVYAVGLGSPRAHIETPRVNPGAPKGEPGFAPSGHIPGPIDHSATSVAASPAPRSTAIDIISPRSRDWSRFQADLDVLTAWLDQHIPGWDQESGMMPAVWMMWEEDRHPKSILEYVARANQMRLAG